MNRHHRIYLTGFRDWVKGAEHGILSHKNLSTHFVNSVLINDQQNPTETIERCTALIAASNLSRLVDIRCEVRTANKLGLRTCELGGSTMHGLVDRCFRGREEPYLERAVKFCRGEKHE